MLPKRIRISKSAADTLKLLKARTGVTPNIVCRMALLTSLESGKEGGLKITDTAGSEFNAPTLFGEYGLLFECLVRQVHGELDNKATAAVLASHIDDGLEALRKSRSLLDLVRHSGLSKRPA
ncbi:MULTISPECIES: DNA sulfur modification protein DndE [unclassified Caballeronia]|uniref:DNA sulfur modification protein DndE n=1 Tax=unclassified Caballeronia TaxID=2646786 RepID=UPI0020281A2F|nr:MULTISPECIES: DNA sulfur modification protein DndE [unclassified Caballeronia]